MEEVDVFVCHNSRDNAIAQAICAGLSDRGATVWVDDRDLHLGSHWQDKLQQALQAAKAAAVMLGPHGVGDFQMTEIRELISQRASRGMVVVPVLLPNGPTYAEARKKLAFLFHSQWVDFRNGVTSEGLDTLAEAMRAIWADKPPLTLTGVALPTKPLHLFGRHGELTDLAGRLLSEGRPLPILVQGAPGIGKSTLVLCALHDDRVKARFGNERYFVRCDSATTRNDVVDQLAISLGLQGANIENRFLWRLAQRPTLLVLDNFETPWWGDAAGTEVLLAELSRIETVALVLTIRGLLLPGGVPWGGVLRLDRLNLEDAREAFLAVAGNKELRNDVCLDPLVEALGRVPLALTLLAKNAQGEPDLKGIFADWKQAKKRLTLLRQPGRDGRLCDMGASIYLSVRSPCMTDEGRRVLSLLGLLPDGIAHADLDHVAPGAGNAGARALRQASLALDENKRLCVLAPVRDYAAEALRPVPDELCGAVDFYCRLAKEEGWKAGAAGGAQAIARLARELANVEAMICAGLRSGTSLAAIDAAVGLGEFVRFSGLGNADVLESAAEKARSVEDFRRLASSLKKIGDVALQRNSHGIASERYKEALDLFSQDGDLLGQAVCIKGLGDVALWRWENGMACRRYEEALPLYQQVDDRLGQANCIASLGHIAIRSHDHATAGAKYEDALCLFVEACDLLGQAICIKGLGDVARQRGSHAIAHTDYEQALAHYQSVGDVYGQALCTEGLAIVAADRGDDATARARYEEASSLFQLAGSLVGRAYCTVALGDIAVQSTDYDTARTRYEEALPFFVHVGDRSGQAKCTAALEKITAGHVERESAALRDVHAQERANPTRGNKPPSITASARSRARPRRARSASSSSPPPDEREPRIDRE